jgi:hypothetical protein
MARSARRAAKKPVPDIGAGFDAFLHDGDEKFGSVRDVDANEVVVYVENSGDVRIPRDAVVAVHAQKIIVDCKKAGHELCDAIGHAHDAEEPGL